MPTTPPPNIDPTPTPAPQRSDRAAFSSRVDAFVTWLQTGVTQIYAAALNCYNNAVEAYNSAVSASTSATNAASSASAAASTANAAPWVSGTYALNAAAISQIDFQTYRCTVAGNRTIDPASDPTNWVKISGAASGNGAETRTTSATLTAASAAVQILNMSGFGKALTLPDARTLTTGATRFVANNLRGKYPGGIIDGSGRVLGQVNDGELVEFHLDDNATAAGIWSYTGNLDPWFIDSDTGIDIATSGSVSILNLDATRFVIYYQKPTTGYPAVRLITDNGAGAAPTISNELVLKTANATVDQGNSKLVGTSNRILFRLNDSSVVCADISNPATITGGAAASLTFTGGSLNALTSVDNQYVIAVATDSSATLLRAKCIDCGTSGTAVLVGAEANTSSYTYVPSIYFQGKIDSATVGVFGRYNAGGSYHRAILHSLTRTSGTTLSWSANAGDPTGYRTDSTNQKSDFFVTAADKIMLPFYANSDAGRYVVVTFAASSTPTFGSVANSGVTASGRAFNIVASPDRSKFVGYANGDATAKNIEIVTVSGSTITVGAATPVTADSTINSSANMQAAIDNNGRGFVTWRSSIYQQNSNDKLRLFTSSGTTPTFSAEVSGAVYGGINGLASQMSVADMQSSCGSGVFRRYAYEGASPYQSINVIFTVNADATENVLAEVPSFQSSVTQQLIAGGVSGVYVSNPQSTGVFPGSQTIAIFATGGYKIGSAKYWGASLNIGNGQSAPNQRNLRLSFQYPDTKPGRNATLRAYRFAEA